MLKLRRADDKVFVDQIVEVAKLMAESFELKPLLESIERAAVNLLACQQAQILEYDPRTDQFFRSGPYAGFGDFRLGQPVATASQFRISARDGASGQAAITQHVVVVPAGAGNSQALVVPLTTPDGELMGILHLLGRTGHQFEVHETKLALVLGALAAIAIKREILSGLAAERQRLERELAVAREIAQVSLPVPPPFIPGFEVTGYFRPANSVGGDFYDLVRTSNGLDFLIADASGHGLDSALLVSRCSSYFRALATTELLSTLDTAHRVNQLLYTDLCKSDHFVAACLGRLDPTLSRITWLRAGLAPPLLARASGLVSVVDQDSGPPFGIQDTIAFAQHDVSMEPGDVLLFFTDGLVEWADPSGQRYGDERLKEALLQCRGLPTGELLERLYQDAARSGQGRFQEDDVTMLLVKCCR